MNCNPTPFELTQAEAVRVMAVQSDRQAAFAREGAAVQRLPLLVPLLSLVALLALNAWVLPAPMSTWIYIGLIVAYLMGLFVQLIAMATGMKETKRRMLMDTPQVWEKREIQVQEDGLVHSTPTSVATYFWTSLRNVERDDDFIWFWLTEFNAIVVPLRAFASASDADEFEAQVRRLRDLTQ